MAIRLGPLGTSGTCCTCEEFTGCDCGAASCGLICESKDLAASLCGYEEYTTPSSPPKKYRKRTLSGAVSGNGYVASDCSGSPVGGSTDTFSGSCTYDAATCALEEGGRRVRFVTGDPDCSGPEDDVTTCTIGNAFVFVGDTFLLTATTRERQNSLACGVNVGGGPCPYPKRDTAPTDKETLSEEDTEDDAEDRAAAAVSEWTPCSGECDCSTLTAYRADRGSGFSWSARRVRIKATGSSLVPSSSYQATIQYQRRLYGSSDAWEDFAQEFQNLFTGEAETTATAADWVEIPNSRGYETRAFCSGIELLT